MKTAVLGCGNPNRSDDGVGPMIVGQLLSRRRLPNVSIHDCGTDGMAVIYRIRGIERLIVVDACAPTGTPGAVYEVPGQELESPPPSSLNLHDFRWDHALYSARRILGTTFPKIVQVFLIEAKSLDLGLVLSREVLHAANQVIQRIEARLIRQDPIAGNDVSGFADNGRIRIPKRIV